MKWMAHRVQVWSLAVLWLVVGGCQQPPDPTPTPAATPIPTPTPAQITVDLKISSGPYIAGASIPWSVTVLADPGGDVTSQAQIEIVTDPAEGATVEQGSLVLTRATTYTVTARATLGSELYLDSAPVTILPAQATGMTVSVTPNPAPAGTACTARASLVDTYGNVAVDGIAALYEVLPAEGVEVTGSTLLTTAAGTYTVGAVSPSTGFSATTTWQVDPLVSQGLAIDLSQDRILPGESVTATAFGVDLYGNRTPVDVSWEVEPEEGVRGSGNRFTFSDEGVYVLHAATEEGVVPALSGDSSPITVDGTRPLLTVTAPERASFLGDPTIEVVGTSSDELAGLSGLTLNDLPVEVGRDGSFRHPFTPRVGLNTLQLEATDLNGNTTQWVQAFLWAQSWLPNGGRVSDAFYGRMAQPTIDILGDLLESFLTVEEMQALLFAENPMLVLYDEYELCLFGNCTTYVNEIYLNFLSLTYSDVQVLMTPLADEGSGLLGITVTFDDLAGTLEAYGQLASSEIDTVCGDLTTDYGTARGYAVASFDEEGHSDVVLNNVSVDLGGFQMEMCDGSLDELMDAIQDEVEGELEDLLVDLIKDEVPALLEDALDSLTLNESFDLGGVPITLNAALGGMTFDSQGSTLWMWSEVAAEAAPGTRDNPGTPLTPSSPPDFKGGERPFYIAGNDDLLNQLLYALWIGGGLNLTYSDEDLGFTQDQLEVLFNGATTLEMRISPALQPILSPAGVDSPYLMDAGLGDTYLEIWTDAYTGITGELGLDYRLAVALVAGADAVAPTPTTLSVIFADVSVLVFQVLQQPEERPLPEETLNELLLIASDELMAYLNSYLANIPIPTIEGYTVAIYDLFMSGPSGDYLTIGGELLPPEPTATPAP